MSVCVCVGGLCIHLHGLTLCITISSAQTHSRTLGILLMDYLCASHLRYSNSKLLHLLTAVSMATARCCAAHINLTPHASLALGQRKIRHLFLFPPEAAENNQEETKSKRTYRRCQETAPRGTCYFNCLLWAIIQIQLTETIWSQTLDNKNVYIEMQHQNAMECSVQLFNVHGCLIVWPLSRLWNGLPPFDDVWVYFPKG